MIRSRRLRKSLFGNQVFKNRKRTRILIERTYCVLEGECIHFYASSKYGRNSGDSEGMPVTMGALVLSFQDYEEILDRVLAKDKIAKRFFIKLVRSTVINNIFRTKLGDYLLPSGRPNYDKIQEYDAVVSKKLRNMYYERKRKKSNNT